MGADDKSEERDAPVQIVPYDPAWPALFEQEKTLLAHLISPWLAGPIEHVGSTAVPGLAAKPVIDIMAAVETLTASRPAIPALREIGYVYFPYQPEEKHWFCKPSAAFRTHHLHLVPFGSQSWKERLAFRDYLRRHATIAADYAALKRQLAEQYEFDREAYTVAKGAFIRRVVNLALPDEAKKTA